MDQLAETRNYPPPSYSSGESQVSSANVICMQPGSKYLRLGRASEEEPLTVLHAIARKRKTQSPGPTQLHKLPQVSLLSEKSFEDKLPPEVESARLQLCHTLQTSLKPDGNQRYITPSSQISAFNKISKVEVLQEKRQCNSVEAQPETVIGDAIVQLASDSNYNIHFPWRRGRFNLHAGIGGSLNSVLNDLENIWDWTLSEKLGIPRKTRSHFRAIIIIPALFDKRQTHELMTLVLHKLQFSHAFVVYDHVCATFGSALSYACVVDIGDQKISISCVEEGVSIPETKLELKYGGGDLTLALWNLLLSQSSVPFKLDLSSLWDLTFLNKLKEELCHFDLSRCGPEEHTVVWNKPGEPVIRYNILLGDELLIVPLSYFNPDLLRASLEATTKSNSTLKAPDVFDDPFDAAYVTKYARIGRSRFEEDEEEEEEEEGDDDSMEDIKDVELLVNEGKKLEVDQLQGVDQAILHSIDAYEGGEELKRRFYSCILVVGGGFKFRGLGSWLQNKIALNIPRAYRSDTVEVITFPKDKDPSGTAWRGGAMLSHVETTTELWISEAEWNTHGSKIFKERSLCAI